MRINCDLGEGLDNDAAIMPHLHMANIACAAHAGDEACMRRTIELARQHQVEIGAHIGFEDKEHFGRREINLSSAELKRLCQTQLDLMARVCASMGARFTYVKPHGALYNMMMRDRDILALLMQAVAAFDNSLRFMLMAVPEHGDLEALAQQHQIRLIHEAFVDRAYTDDGRLLPRSEPGASHQTLEQIQVQAKDIIENNQIETIKQKQLPVSVQTLCIHGDHALAVEVAQLLRSMVDELCA